MIKKSFISFAIKSAAALFSYLMMVGFANIMTASQFGLFAICFSLGMFLSKVTLGGQGQALLRDVAANVKIVGSLDSERINEIVSFGYIVVCYLSLVIILAASIFSLVYSDITFFAAALLASVVAFSELKTSVLRGLGSIACALLPREVLWRLGVLFVILVLAFLGQRIGLFLAMTILTIVLVVTLLLCPLSQLKVKLRLRRKVALLGFVKLWFTNSKSFWLAAVIFSGVPVLSTVIVGALLSPIEAGSYFAALKTSQLINIVSSSVNLVGAPLIARFYKQARYCELKRIISMTVLLSGVAGLFLFFLILLYGDLVLGLFDTQFSSSHNILIILSLSYLVTALFGSNGQVLQMTGNESYFVKILVVSNLTSLVMMPVATVCFGAIGAAYTLLFTFLWWNTWAWLVAIKKVGVDTCFVGGGMYFFRNYFSR